MRIFVCLSIVLLLATTVAAQFGNTAPANSATRANDRTSRKTDRRGEPAAKANDQTNAENDLAGTLLHAMDTDGDGMVTKAEFSKAMAALRKVHKDSKGNMTVPEKAADAAAANPNGDPAQADAAAQGAAAADGRGNEAMAQFMRYDANHDGVLSPNEVPAQGRAMLQGADLNRDGVIDAREMQTYSRHMSEQARAWAGGVDPTKAGGVPGDGRPRRPQQ